MLMKCNISSERKENTVARRDIPTGHWRMTCAPVEAKKSNTIKISKKDALTVSQPQN